MPEGANPASHCFMLMSKSTSVALCQSGPAAAPPTTTISRLMAAPALPSVGPCILLLPRQALPGCSPALLLPGAAPPGCQPALLPLASGILPGPRPLLLLLAKGLALRRFSPGLLLPGCTALPRGSALLVLPSATTPQCRPLLLLPEGAALCRCRCRPALLMASRAALPGDGSALLMPARATVPRCGPALLLLLLHRGPTAPGVALPQLLLGALGQHPVISTAPAHLHTGVMGTLDELHLQDPVRKQQWKGRQCMFMTG